MTEPLTADDIDQIIEGIELFIIEGHADLIPVLQPYIDKLTALKHAIQFAGVPRE